jgi:serine/threonine protein kinase
VKNPTTHEDKAAVLLPDGPTAPLVGQLIEHYKIVALLGKGGMGEVYLAEDTKLGRSIALKILPSDIGSRRHLESTVGRRRTEEDH